MNIYNLLFIICLSFSYIFSSIPNKYSLFNIKLDRHNFSYSGSIASNAVIDIKTVNDSIYFFGTANGLSSAKITNTDSIIFDVSSEGVVVPSTLVTVSSRVISPWSNNSFTTLFSIFRTSARGLIQVIKQPISD